MIKLRNINKTYYSASPLHVLKGIDLDINQGDFVSIIGASGSGKSNTIRALTTKICIFAEKKSDKYPIKTR